MEYPDEIVLEEGSPEYKNLTKHSQLLANLVENEPGNLTLTSDLLFGGDTNKWQMFVDVFFPELGVKRFFLSHKNGKISVDPKRGTKKDLINILDYMDVDNKNTMMNFAKEQARKSINMESATVPRGVGIRTPGKGALAYAAQQARYARNNGYGYGYGFGNNNNNRYNNNNNNNNNNVNIGNNNNIGNYNNNNNNNNQNNTNLPRPQGLTLGNFIAKRKSRRNRKNRRSTRKANQMRRQTRRS